MIVYIARRPHFSTTWVKTHDYVLEENYTESIRH